MSDDRGSVASLERELRTEAAEAEAWAALRQLPVRTWSEGRSVHLVRIVDGRPVYLMPHNARAAGTTGTDQLLPGGQSGLALTGSGMTIGLWDAGHVFAGHAELAGRVDFGDGAPLDRHATHVAGTLAASGVRPAAKGMAPEALVESYDWHADAVEMLAFGQRGELLSNHSYGPTAGWTFADLEGRGEQWYWLGDTGVNATEDYAFGRYDRDAARWDLVAGEAPHLLPIVSAGNDRGDTGPSAGSYRYLDSSTGSFRSATVQERYIPPDGGLDGYDSIAGAALAKNVLTVGSVGHLSDDPGAPVVPSRFSSFGPTDDGRLKPDLVADGERLLSTGIGAPDAYAELSGTSMAAANCSGSLLLLQQLHVRLTGEPMKAATLKGLAIHTARDVAAEGPDYQTGWGLLDVAAAARHLQTVLTNPVAVMERALAETAETEIRLVKLDEGPIRITLSWTDLPGEPAGGGNTESANPRLIRDLDMTLTHLGSGIRLMPYVLDASNPSSTAVKGDNDVDPVERIDVAAAPIGEYALHIRLEGGSEPPRSIPFSVLVSGLTDRERLVSVSGLRFDVSGDKVGVEWTAIGQQREGWFVLSRTVLDGGPGLGRGFVDVDSVLAEGAPGAGRVLAATDTAGFAGEAVYRLRFRSPGFEPTLERQDTLVVPAAALSDVRSEVTQDAVALAATISDVRLAGNIRLERQRLGYDVFGDPVLGPPRRIEPDVRASRNGRLETSWTDRYPPAGRFRYTIGLATEVGLHFELGIVDVLVPEPETAAIVRVFPNPFRHRTKVVFDSPGDQLIMLRVFDAVGRLVDSIVNETLPAGRHEWTLDGARWPSGVMFLDLVVGRRRSVTAINHVR